MGDCNTHCPLEEHRYDQIPYAPAHHGHVHRARAGGFCQTMAQGSSMSNPSSDKMTKPDTMGKADAMKKDDGMKKADDKTDAMKKDGMAK